MSWFKRKTCSHKFDYKDLVGRETPNGNVKWPCWKCGKVFEEYCGLEVLTHGEVQEKEYGYGKKKIRNR